MRFYAYLLQAVLQAAEDDAQFRNRIPPLPVCALVGAAPGADGACAAPASGCGLGDVVGLRSETEKQRKAILYSTMFDGNHDHSMKRVYDLAVDWLHASDELRELIVIRNAPLICRLLRMRYDSASCRCRKVDEPVGPSPFSNVMFYKALRTATELRDYQKYKRNDGLFMSVQFPEGDRISPYWTWVRQPDNSLMRLGLKPPSLYRHPDEHEKDENDLYDIDEDAAESATSDEQADESGLA